MGSALLVIVLGWTAAGVPLPAGKVKLQSGELFPCAACKCGCVSAEQCWRSCCCHTLVERLAWAREHGVEPPAFALAEARSIGLLADELAAGHRVATATGSRETKTCCTKKAEEKVPTCCQKKSAVAVSAARSCCHKHVEQPAAAPTDEPHDNGIVAWRALACRGQTLNWLAVVPTTTVTRMFWSQQLPCVSWLGPTASERGESVSDDPAVPPPEWA